MVLVIDYKQSNTVNLLNLMVFILSYFIQLYNFFFSFAENGYNQGVEAATPIEITGSSGQTNV